MGFLSSAYVYVLPVTVVPALNARQTELKCPLFLDTLLEKSRKSPGTALLRIYSL